MPLSSHPVSQDAVEDVEDEQQSVEVDEDEHCTIKVTQTPGFLCHISATARIRIPPRILWEQCIVHPDNAKIYRHMTRCSFRRVGPTDPTTGIRSVRVAHEASWRFLLFHGVFTTHLNVIEDPQKYSMRFTMIPHGSSIVSKFQGEWRIEPDTEDPEHSSISHLEQDLALGVWMPPPLDRLLKSISARQVRRIVEDLQTEARKIQKKRPSLGPYEEVKDKDIGEEVPMVGVGGEESNVTNGGNSTEAAFRVDM
jgi:hypothetical protein